MKPDLEWLHLLFEKIQNGEIKYSEAKVKYIYDDGRIEIKKVSPSTLRRLFNEHLGETPFEIGKKGNKTKISSDERDLIIQARDTYQCGINKIYEILILNKKPIAKNKIQEIFKEFRISDDEIPPVDISRTRYLVSHVNGMWHGDIHYVMNDLEVRYLFALLDDRSRLIISYGLSTEKNSEFVVSVFKNAFLSAKPLCYFCDNGMENVSSETLDFLKENDVSVMTTFPHTPQQNGKIESFWKPLEKRINNEKNKKKTKLGRNRRYY